MDKRWKALTAPLWIELMQMHSQLCRIKTTMLWGREGNEFARRSYNETRARLRSSICRPVLLKLLAMRKARLEGQDPVYWALANK